jgi:HEAT repeat protein
MAESVCKKQINPSERLMAWLDTLLLKCPNPRMRCKAVQNLSGSTRPSDTELLFASLRDEDAQVRCAAVRALGKANSAHSQKCLIDALRDASFEVRETAARTLGQLGALNSVGALAACLRDPDAAVRIAAAGALRSMNWKPSTREELAWFEIALGNTPAAVSTGGVLADPTVEKNQDTAFFRSLAAEALKERTDPIRINSLLLGLRSKGLLTRVSAVHDLGEISGPKISEELLRLFRDPEPEVRLAVAQVMAERDGSPPAHFLGLLQDTSAEVRLAAVQFFARVRNQHIAEVLFPLLSDPDLQVRQATATALGLIGDASALEPLVVSLVDQDDHMRHTAERALREIDPAWMHSEAAQSARGQLEMLLSIRPPEERGVIEHVLSRLPAPITAAREVAQPPQAY